MRPVRLGAVDYLNARPLVYGLELRHGFALQFDPPSKCAALLHEGSIDVGMIPSIEYLRGVPYHAVPDMAIVSEGPVASVAMFTTKPLHEIRSVAADTSSRTSNGLLRVLCYESFGIDPVHFGIVMLLNLGIGLLTPPVGTTLFVGCAIGKVSVDEVMRGIWPFYYVMFTVLMIVTYVPWLSLALPRAFGF